MQGGLKKMGGVAKTEGKQMNSSNNKKGARCSATHLNARSHRNLRVSCTTSAYIVFVIAVWMARCSLPCHYISGLQQLKTEVNSKGLNRAGELVGDGR